MRVRKLAAGDLDAVLSIQAGSPEVARWLREDYERAVGGEFAGWVAEREVGVIGFIIARLVGDEVEILNLAIAPDMRRAGAGSALLREALEWGKAAGAQRAFLEVRETNFAAILFYERNGFLGAGRRPRYYTSPTEDALVLAMHLAGHEKSFSAPR